MGGDDASDEALLSNLFATCHAVAVLTVIDLLEAMLDLPNVDPLSVSDSQLEVTVGLHCGNVERVCKRLFVVCQVAQSLSGLLQKPLEAFLEEILKNSRRSFSINLLAWGTWFGWQVGRDVVPLLRRKPRFTKPSCLPWQRTPAGQKMPIFSSNTANCLKGSALSFTVFWSVDRVPGGGCRIGECSLAGMGGTVRANPWDPMTAHAAPGMVWLDGRFEIGASGRYGNDDTSLWQVGAYDAQTTRVGFGVFWSRLTQSIEPKNDELPGWRQEDEEFDNYIRAHPSSPPPSAAAVSTGSSASGLVYGTSTGAQSSAVQSTPSPCPPSLRSFRTRSSSASLRRTSSRLEIPTLRWAVSTGTRWQISRRFALAVDTETDFVSLDNKVAFTPMLGAEFRAGDVVPLRLGWKRDGIEGTRWLTGGIGVENESVGLSYGFSLDLWSEDEAVHQHGVMLRISM